MPTTGLVLDERFEQHDTGPEHPERSARLAAIRKALIEAGLVDRCERITPEPIKLADLDRLHEPHYRERFKQACLRSASYIDVPDSAICPASYDIALLAAGTTVKAVDAVMAGQINNAFCAVRPPGHHAERDCSMGFCMFNNIALAADRLLTRHGLERVLIVDFDVHHGNATQHTFEAEPRVMFISIHGHPNWVYPGTGYTTERGLGEGEGFTLNVPLMPNSTGADYRQAFQDKIMPAGERYKPQFVLVSAGFDAHRLDPLAPLSLETEDFSWMTRWILDLAYRHCQGRLVSVLEGGYHLSALAACTVGHVQLLRDHAPSGDQTDHESGAW